MLAASHAVGRNAVNDEEVATFLANNLLQRYGSLIAQRYSFDVTGFDGTDVVEAIAKKRGYVERGGTPDIDKAAQVLLVDYRTGVLGRISLESPETRKAMIDVVTPADLISDERG
jgi:ribosome biogenesis GTPase A